MAKPLVLCALLFPPPDSLLGQTTTAPTRDPNAVALGGKALQALPGLTTISDVTLESTAPVLVALDFNLHRDNDANLSMPVGIRYNPYKFDRAGPRASSQPN